MNHLKNIEEIEEKILRLKNLKLLNNRAIAFELKIFRHSGTLNQRDKMNEQLDKMNEEILNFKL